MSSIIRKAAALLMVAVLACGAMALNACSNNSSGSASGNDASKSAAANTNTSTGNKNTNAASNASTAKNANSSSQQNANYVSSVSDDDPYAKGIHHATVTVEGYEPFVIELDADSAPITVSNFCKLAEAGFYDGLTFYRFQDKFCMQGGSSNNGAAVVNDGLTPIKGEFASNGVKNGLADNYQKGTVAMARSQDPNSAKSTFFVTLGGGDVVKQSLNGNYAAFGTIDADGMAIVDQVVADHVTYGDPSMGIVEDSSHQAKIESVKITD